MDLALTKRWKRSDVDELLLGLKHGRLREPFGATAGGLVDLRGVRLPDGTILRGLQFERCDLSQACMPNAWIEECHFDRVLFDDADLTGVRDHGNRFTGCRFAQTKCREAALGYRGSAYQNCGFDAVDYWHAIFIRAEFDDCEFIDCRLKGVDFNASSFVRCSFVGVLEDVWFRGGFALPSDSQEFGQARKNAMKHVSFEKAELHDITYSDHCDLSTVVVPSRGDYRLYSNWKNRLLRLKEATREWSTGDKQEAKVFLNSSFPHAQNQEWELLNCEDMRAEYGQGIGNRILRVLEGP